MHPRNTILFASSILIAVVVATAWLVWPQKQRETTAEQRVALLIGNTNYKSWGRPLKNPKNDVKAVARQLRSLGFATTVIYDGTSEQISTAIKAFHDDASGSDWALIYYAGAGIEVDGTNYMIPIDADDSRAAQFTKDFEQMRLDTAFEAVQGARRLRLVITDACRIDPSKLPGHSGQSQANPARKFKVVPPPHGVVVAYSTDAGQQAQDGTNDISPYAEVLAEALREPGIEISKVFRLVSARVEAATSRAQSPTILGNWPGEDLYVSRK